MSVFSISVQSELEQIGSAERRGWFVLTFHPADAPADRPPIRLVLALDVSGSMAGPKITSVIRTSQAVVKALGPHDVLGCVTFNDAVRTILEPTPIGTTGRPLILQRLASMQADGGTDLAGGALRALSLASHPKEVGRVLLLTDGQPTVGVTDRTHILTLCSGARTRSVLSTLGFGRDVDAALLSKLADDGQGNYTFVEGHEAPVQAIGSELGGAILTVAADMRVMLSPASGVKVEQILRPEIRPEAQTGFDLPPLIANEPVSIVFELSWTEQANSRPLALIVARGRSTKTGEEEVHEAKVTLTTGPSRGAFHPTAARDVLIARAAMLLDRIARIQENRAAAQVLLEGAAEIRGAAQAAGVQGDPQYMAAMAMMDAAYRELQTAHNGAQRHATVTAAASLKKKRASTLGGMHQGAEEEFTQASQIVGSRMIQAALDDDKT